MERSGSLVLLLLPNDVRLILRRERNRFRLDTLTRAFSSSPDPVLDRTLREIDTKALRLRTFVSPEEARITLTNELERLKVARRQG